MDRLSDNKFFIVEIIDLSTASEHNPPVVHERRGTFTTYREAAEWWVSQMTAPQYAGCIGYVTVVEPATKATS